MGNYISNQFTNQDNIENNKCLICWEQATKENTIHKMKHIISPLYF